MKGSNVLSLALIPETGPSDFSPQAANRQCAIGCVKIDGSHAKDAGPQSPIYGVALPDGHRDWPLIAPATEDDPLNELRAVVGSPTALAAYRSGGLPFADGTVLVKLAWKRTQSAEFEPASIPGAPTTVQVTMVVGCLSLTTTAGDPQHSVAGSVADFTSARVDAKSASERVADFGQSEGHIKDICRACRGVCACAAVPRHGVGFGLVAFKRHAGRVRQSALHNQRRSAICRPRRLRSVW